jgi:hypothetical protein
MRDDACVDRICGLKDPEPFELPAGLRWPTYAKQATTR